MPEVQAEPEDNNSEEIEEHEEKMRKKASGEDVEEDKEEQELLAGKYESEEELQKGIIEAAKSATGAEDLEEAYKNLESQLGQSDSSSSGESGTDSDLKIGGEGEEDKEEGEGSTAPDTDEVDFSKYEQEFSENQELSEESKKELEEMGYDREFIDRYERGLQAEVQELKQTLHDITGGEEEYQKMMNWAEDNLSESQQELFNNAIESGDTDQVEMMVKAIYNDYQEATGEASKPNLVRGKSKSPSTSDKYESRAELMEDMRTEKYQEDPAFRREVQRKLANSNIF